MGTCAHAHTTIHVCYSLFPFLSLTAPSLAHARTNAHARAHARERRLRRSANQVVNMELDHQPTLAEALPAFFAGKGLAADSAQAACMRHLLRRHLGVPPAQAWQHPQVDVLAEDGAVGSDQEKAGQGPLRDRYEADDGASMARDKKNSTLALSRAASVDESVKAETQGRTGQGEDDARAVGEGEAGGCDCLCMYACE